MDGSSTLHAPVGAISNVWLTHIQAATGHGMMAPVLGRYVGRQ